MSLEFPVFDYALGIPLLNTVEDELVPVLVLKLSYVGTASFLKVYLLISRISR